MITLKIRRIGSSAGVILPVEALNYLSVEEGDSLFPATSAGGYEVTPYAPEFAKPIDVALQGIEAYRTTLRELMK